MRPTSPSNQLRPAKRLVRIEGRFEWSEEAPRAPRGRGQLSCRVKPQQSCTCHDAQSDTNDQGRVSPKCWAKELCRR